MSALRILYQNKYFTEASNFEQLRDIFISINPGLSKEAFLNI